MIDLRIRNSDLRIGIGRSAFALPLRNSQSPSRYDRARFDQARKGLTLIELLVVIVILTTLVGGVIPVLSPNNDTRKIRAAARGLQGYITQIQAEAARTGRPHGIGFRESSVESGDALEVFGLEVPPPFGGFSTESRVVVAESTPVFSGQALVYNPGGRVDSRLEFSPQYDGMQLYTLSFVLGGDPANVIEDPLPLRTFQIGDEIDIDGNLFVIVDTSGNSIFEYVGEAPNSVRYLGRSVREVRTVSAVECVWINNSGQVPPQGLKRYTINRQPSNSSASPYQLPSSIAIDMQASIVEGSGRERFSNLRFPTATSLYTDRSALPENEPDNPIPSDFVGIMFSPTGAVDRLIFNNKIMTDYSRIVLLIGRAENAGIDPDVDNTPRPWVFQDPSDKEELENKQETINWLSPDSRLVSIVPGNGRVVVSEPAFVDPSLLGDPNVAEQQIEAAHGFAHEMTTVGSN